MVATQQDIQILQQQVQQIPQLLMVRAQALVLEPAQEPAPGLIPASVQEPAPVLAVAPVEPEQVVQAQVLAAQVQVEPAQALVRVLERVRTPVVHVNKHICGWEP